jgi:hypothetical protein
MGRILRSCAASLILYLIVFGALADRPLSLGLLDDELSQKTAALAALRSPKIVILAGSNGPYSHSCVVIGEMLDLPCENAGIAVGIGLDVIFTRYAPLLHAGDVIYMPMELAQYTRTRAQYRASADAAMLLREDPQLLPELSAGRMLGAMFCCNLADLVEAAVEMPLAQSGRINPQKLLLTEYNPQGDRIDNTPAAADMDLLRHISRSEPAVPAITGGYGELLIAHFVRSETARHIIVIGGLPTDDAAAPLGMETIDALASTYRQNGGNFLVLPNHSLYPIQDFLNGEDHLVQSCQMLHSESVAEMLGTYLHRMMRQPTNAIALLAASCPSAAPG